MLVLLLLAILLLHAHTVAGMVSIWARSDTYAHGFVVPVISLWLIWRIRHTLAALVPKAWLQAGLKKRFGLNRSL